MNRYSELEIKLSADGLSPQKFIEFVLKSGAKVDSLQVLSGMDTFYRKGKEVVRHRCDGDGEKSVLTVKKRKSKESLVDRHEVDLPVAPGVPPEDVAAFLELAGWKEEYSIRKVYWIFHIKEINHRSCVAMYDVWKTGGFKNNSKSSPKKYRFLEVEIERDSECSTRTGESLLSEWLSKINNDILPEAKPLNVSLYELFKKD